MDKENSGINTSSAQEEEEGTNVDPELVKQFFVAAKSSLLHNFDRIVKPVPDDDYSDYVDQYHFVLENKRSFEDEIEEENDHDRNGKKHAYYDDDDEEEEPEIDEEELIDASAWMDARELRSRVRAKAARVQQLRERVLNATKNRVTKICLQPHVTDVKPEIIMGGEESTSATTTTKSVNESLKALSSLLEDPKWQQFPERIQSLQDTIEVMQKDSAPNRLLSQTELAITGGRRNIAVTGNNVVDGIPEDATAEGQEVAANQYKDPMEDILAQKVLLMQVQDNGSNNDDDRFGLESHQGDENDVGDDMHMDVDDKENSTAQPMDAIDRLALFGHMFS
mmetsp:Transcript_11634/g.27872  ORF Transcript_11634/g.27872 Transcript_11634/m.27872 type:complete len:337 (+) Transcript_11634:232-1242(+)